jgi:hypothetical protein
LSICPIILLSEVVTLAWALRGFAHNEIRSSYLGFLMTVMLGLMAKERPARHAVSQPQEFWATFVDNASCYRTGRFRWNPDPACLLA